jgi:hypothetical protein
MEVVGEAGGVMWMDDSKVRGLTNVNMAKVWGIRAVWQLYFIRSTDRNGWNLGDMG